MCNQTVCLIAAELERAGIPTVVIQLLRMVTEKVGPPRALWVPFRHGYPLDTPNDPVSQRGDLTGWLICGASALCGLEHIHGVKYR